MPECPQAPTKRAEGDSRITIVGFVHMIELVSPGALLVARAAGDRLPGGAQNDRGIGVVSFLTAVGSGSIIFLIQFLLFLFLRKYLVRVL